MRGIELLVKRLTEAENRDEILKTNDGRLTDTVKRANSIFNRVKQTNDATLDSRLLVNVSDLAYRKANQLVFGDSSTGIDVDEFLSKCLSYMRNGGHVEDDETSRATKTAMMRATTMTQARLWTGNCSVDMRAFLTTPDHQSQASCWAHCLCRRSNARKHKDAHVRPETRAGSPVQRISPVTISTRLARMT